MIQLADGICYSPYPVVSYRHTEILPSGGLASFFGDDLQMWNLAWLTDPAWDQNYSANSPTELIAASKALDNVLAGLCKRSLTMDDDIEDFGTPTLRSLLRRPPREFMRAFSNVNPMALELTATYGSPLMQTMWSRARLSQPIDSKEQEEPQILKAMSNVIPFRKIA
jgi:hypothetical protein